MKNKSIVALMLLIVIGLSACSSKQQTGSDSSKNESVSVSNTEPQTSKEENSKADTSGKQLVSTITKPENITFETADFENTGKAEFPKGDDWEKQDNEYYNEKLDMTILTQSQPGNFLDQIKDFTDSYTEVNKRDAPKYEIVKTEEGEINSIKAVRIDGKFDNGTAYVTRDYLLFTDKEVVVLMSRAEEKNAKELNNIVDYIASTIKK